jgi:hypothetical protein
MSHLMLPAPIVATSFGRSFLNLNTSTTCSLRRAVLLMLLAKRRWPKGRMYTRRHADGWVVRYLVKDKGSWFCGAMIQIATKVS